MDIGVWDIASTFFMVISMIAMIVIGYGIGFINGKRSSLPSDFFNKTKKTQSLSEIKKKAKRKSK